MTSSQKAVLIIDDNPSIATAMEIAGRVAGYRLDIAAGPEEAMSRLSARRYDCILLDLNFAPGASDGQEGLSLLKRILAEDPLACVVVLTAHGGIRVAVAAMQEGARDFAMKPWRNEDLVAKMENAMSRGASSGPTQVPVRSGEPPHVLLVGESAAMRALRALVRKVGPTPASVAICGPSGSGRTLTAIAIHAASSDPEPPAIVDARELIERSRLDDGEGTLIIRHLDDLDERTQERLLFLLPSHLRCISVVNSVEPLLPPLKRRLATAVLTSPSLAERDDDVILLARHFTRLAAERFGRGAIKLSDAAERTIQTVQWSDQVRGLALAIERAVLLADGPAIHEISSLADQLPTAAAVQDQQKGSLLEDAEKAIVGATLHQHHHNVTKAASALGISRGALYRKMERYGF